MLKHRIHFEPYVHLVELTSTTALIGWGGFYFYRRSSLESWKLVHDHQLFSFGIDRRRTIGASAESYGPANVRVFDCSGKQIAIAQATDRNFVLIQGLQPDTEYSYEISVNGRPFTATTNCDCTHSRVFGRCITLGSSGRCYDLRFRTFPRANASAPVNIAALGDYGIGIHKWLKGLRQDRVARALELAVENYSLRLVLTTGDNIYLDRSRRDGTGDEDDDWFYSFYQPYRYIISRVPFYPTVGNHDTKDTELSDDRRQLIDNFYFPYRFKHEGEMAQPEPGLVYRFQYGNTVEFLCLDSSFDERRGCRFNELAHYDKFIQKALDPAGENADTGPDWRLIYCHHPPFCAGPAYENDQALVQSLVPLLQQANRKQSTGHLMLSGHEHNFQHARAKGVDYFITGAGGQLRRRRPRGFIEAYTRAWAAEPHFLLLSIHSRKLAVTPLNIKNGRLSPLHIRNTSGKTVNTPIWLSK